MTSVPRDAPGGSAPCASEGFAGKQCDALSVRPAPEAPAGVDEGLQENRGVACVFHREQAMTLVEARLVLRLVRQQEAFAEQFEHAGRRHGIPAVAHVPAEAESGMSGARFS